MLPSRGPQKPEKGGECELRWAGGLRGKGGLSVILEEAWTVKGALVLIVPLS